MAWWPGSSYSPIAVDFGSQGLRLLQLVRRAGGWQVSAMASRTMPADARQSARERTEAISELIHSALGDGRFKGAQAVSGLPASAVHYKNIRLPKMPPDELDAAIQFEASDRLDFKPDRYAVQYFDAGEIRQGDDTREEIIILAAPHKLVDQHLEALTLGGLEPVALEPAPLALARFSRLLPTEDDGGVAVVIDIGHTHSKVAMVRHGRVVFFKLIDIGGQTLDQHVADRLDMPLTDAADLRRRLASEPADSATGNERQSNVRRAVTEAMRHGTDELGREIALCLRYYSVTFRGKRPAAAHLVGGQANDPKVCELLEESIGVQTRPIQPIETLTGQPLDDDGDGTGDWALAIGLAMRGSDSVAKRRAA